MKNACSAATAEGGSFVVATHAGLPASPDALLAAFDAGGTGAGAVQATPAGRAAARVAQARAFPTQGCPRAREEVL
jgi:hypothetical protein